MMRRLIVLLLVCCMLPAFARTAPLEALSAADVPALVKPPAHGERIIALWALDCAYCEPNLAALVKLQRAHPRDVQLVLVATDGPAMRGAVAARLEHMHMTDYPARLYAEPNPERINYLIDPDWGGETPRTLVIRTDGTRVGISGELTPAQLRRVQP